MDYQILECPQCKIMLSVKDDNDQVYACPVCGTLNEKITKKSFHGVLTISSPEEQYEMNMEDGKGMLSFSEGQTDLKKAVETLIKHGWKMKFQGKKYD